MPVYRINKRNVLFIHVPKTGGTSIETYLSAHAEMGLHSKGKRLFGSKDGSPMTWPLPMQHFHGRLLEAMFPADFFDYAFMVVRDPVQRLKSEYRHARALAARVDSQLPFGMWAGVMLSLARMSPNLSNNHYRPQSDFHCFGAEVFRFEDGIDHILATVSERLGLPRPASVPHERNLGHHDFAAAPHVVAAVRDAYRRDYEGFGFDGPAAGRADGLPRSLRGNGVAC